MLAAISNHFRYDLQTFGFRQLRLARICRQEEFAFERQRGGDVKQVNGACAHLFGVRRGKVCGAGESGIHVQCHIEQGAAGNQMFETCQRRITFVCDELTGAGRNGTALMKGALQDGIPHFQRMQGQKKQLGRAQPAILGNDVGESASPVTKCKMKLLSA